ncbi:hypothetical protein F5Y18DRAFT_145109 [Xylariaceae sp. FL1019]|nr:hypothetical protein F5Y18DRAFT_145109 [Xylariaceae sp. FL1019]
MVLRQTAHQHQFHVVGSCYIHGLMDGEALLGPLLPPWFLKVDDLGRKQIRPYFLNEDTGIRTLDDPRLDNIPLPAEWEPVRFLWYRDDPVYCKKFRNKKTGEVINSDPRLSVEALMERGVHVETITLV